MATRSCAASGIPPVLDTQVGRGTRSSSGPWKRPLDDLGVHHDRRMDRGEHHWHERVSAAGDGGYLECSSRGHSTASLYCRSRTQVRSRASNLMPRVRPLSSPLVVGESSRASAEQHKIWRGTLSPSIIVGTRGRIALSVSDTPSRTARREEQKSMVRSSLLSSLRN